MRTVYTVGHSTRTLDELVAMLRAHGVAAVADVWRVAGGDHGARAYGRRAVLELIQRFFDTHLRGRTCGVACWSSCGTGRRCTRSFTSGTGSGPGRPGPRRSFEHPLGRELRPAPRAGDADGAHPPPRGFLAAPSLASRAHQSHSAAAVHGRPPRLRASCHPPPSPVMPRVAGSPAARTGTRRHGMRPRRRRPDRRPTASRAPVRRFGEGRTRRRSKRA